MNDRLKLHSPSTELQRDADCDSDAGVSLVVHVVSVVGVDHVHVVGLIPVVGPVAGPRINQGEPIAAVLEAGEAADHHVGLAVNDKSMARAEVSVVAIVRNAVAVVASALLPRAVLRLPVT